jgi:hypothetical protein
MNTASPGRSPVKDEKLAERICKPVKPINGGAEGKEASYGDMLNVIFWLYKRVLVYNPCQNISPGGGHPKIEITVLKCRKTPKNKVAGRIFSKEITFDQCILS